MTALPCSTPRPGVPDYRSPQGAYSTGFKPMTHQQFLASPANRARYWARSFYGESRRAGKPRRGLRGVGVAEGIRVHRYRKACVR